MKAPLMTFVRRLLLALLLALLALACDYPPSYAYVENPLPPARLDVSNIEVPQGTAVPLVLIANDHSKASGASGATSARSKDERIAVVVPSTRMANAHDGAAPVTGIVFVVYGIAAGSTEIEVFLDGDGRGTLPVTVVAQDP